MKSCSAVASKCVVRCGVNVAPEIGANVRSGGSQVPAIIDGTNSSAPGAIARCDAPTLRRSEPVGVNVSRARGLNSDCSM